MKFAIIAVGLTLSLLFVGAESGRVVADTQSAEETKVFVNWCEICVVLVEWLDAHIANDTERGLDFLFGKVCSVLPGSLRDECESLADELVPILTQLLLEEFIPIKLCRLLTLCSGSETDNKAVLQGDEVPKMMAQYKSDTSKEKQEDFQHFTDDLCAALPFRYNALCHEVTKTTVLQEAMSQIHIPPRD